MKKAILSLLVTAGLSAGVYGQGTISFQNVNGATGLVYFGSTNDLFSGAMSLELFYGPVGDTAAQLLALNTGVIFNTMVTTGVFFDGTTVITSGPAGNGSSDPTQNIELLITGWLGGAANFQAAEIQNGLFGVGLGLPFSNPTGGGGAVPALPASLVNWLSDNPVIITTPEPGTIVLGSLGAAALLLFRRRK